MKIANVRRLPVHRRQAPALPFVCPEHGRELKVLCDDGQVRGFCPLGHEFGQRCCVTCSQLFSYALSGGRPPMHCAKHRR